MARATDCAVIICAYTEHRWDHLLAAIDSVQRQDVAAAQVVVVIDHNPALSCRLRKLMAGATPTVLDSTFPPGLSGARNTGVAASKHSFVAFLDDDAVAEPDWLGHLLAAYTEPRVLGVGGSIHPIWPATRPAWFPEEFDWVVGCSYRAVSVGKASVRNLLGANMSFRRDVLESLGGFRHGLGRTRKQPLGCEETELCIRARQRWPHGRFIHAPLARVHHRVTAERTRWDYFRARCHAEGLSKAHMVRTVGTHDGLSSERTYLLRDLPRGVARGCVHALVHREASGVQRAAAIMGGLAFTAAGYAQGRLS